MSWWQICVIIFSCGGSIGMGVSIIVLAANATSDSSYMRTRRELAEARVAGLRLRKEIEAQAQAHELRLIGGISP